MPANPTLSNLSYPDVLGMITGGERIGVDVVQCAFGLHPRSTAVGQPFEALALLQNTCDKTVQVSLALRLPRKDSAGKALTLLTPKDRVQVNLQPGETGLMFLPIVVQAPGAPSQDNLIGLRVEVKAPRNYKLVRPPFGGRAASVLNMSPFRLSILRDVGFRSVSQEPGLLLDMFNIIPGTISTLPATPAARYEVLWSAKELSVEQAKYAELSVQASKFAATITRVQVLQPLIRATEQKFGQAGMPLHPAEAAFIAKVLTYVMEDGLDLEQGFSLPESRWFNQLAGVMNDQALIGDFERLVPYLYSALIHDGVMLGLAMVEHESRENVGSPNERLSYADSVVSSLNSKSGIDLSHVYLPLVLAGLLLNHQIKSTRENPWTNIAMLREAWQGRLKLLGSEDEWMMGMFSNFTHIAEQNLHKMGLAKPAAKS
jgi:hypothetical protein